MPSPCLLFAALAKGAEGKKPKVLETRLQFALSWMLCGAQSAQRKMLDVLNSVGLSDRLLRLIDRRQRMDKWIVYGGMLLTVLLLGGLLWWLR